MAEWHLKELRDALENRGWRLIAALPGDDRAISADWQFERSSTEPIITLAFEGLADLFVLPLENAYGCHVVGQEKIGLYFSSRPVNATLAA
jgi:hypothetical protein